jgi:hypothetical protein
MPLYIDSRQLKEVIAAVQHLITCQVGAASSQGSSVAGRLSGGQEG